MGRNAMKYIVNLRMRSGHWTNSVVTNYKEYDDLDKALRFYNRLVSNTTRQALKDNAKLTYTICLYVDKYIVAGTKIEGCIKEVEE